MSNTYGFDFLRSEHTLEQKEDARAAALPTLSSVASGPIPQDVENKPDLEKQYIILAFLQAHRGSGCLAPNVIYKATGVDLDLDSNIKLVEMLQHNAKTRVELVPDPENPSIMVATYAYQAKYATVRDRTTLLAQINRMTSGIAMRDLLDSYPSVEEDLEALITAGDVIAVYNSEDRHKILFPRGEAFIVELDGLVSLPPIDNIDGATIDKPKKDSSPGKDSSLDTKVEDVSKMPAPAPAPKIYVVDTDMDPRGQIRRGEAVQVGGQWFRVSSAVKDAPLKEQPARAQAPISVVSLQDLSKRNEVDGYIRPFNAKKLPMDASLSTTGQQNLHKAKAAREKLLKLSHGRTGGVAGQLFGSHAHASNPTTLAKSLANTSSASMRKRPKVTSSLNPAASLQKQQQQQQLQKRSIDELAKAAADPALALFSHARRHGCTTDVRTMYLETRKLVPESDYDLQQLLVKHRLLEPGEQMRRQRLARSGSNVDNDGKPKKRRYYERKNQRMTNTHLEGTEIGAVLARAAEKQKQGKSVGDGGM